MTRLVLLGGAVLSLLLCLSRTAGAEEPSAKASGPWNGKGVVTLPRGESGNDKKELHLYQIDCRYVEVGRDGKQKCIAAPTLRVTEGRPVSFRWDSQVDIPGESAAPPRIAPCGLSFSGVVTEKADATRLRFEMEIENSHAEKVGEDVTLRTTKMHAVRTTKLGQVVKLVLSSTDTGVAKSWVEFILKTPDDEEGEWLGKTFAF